jgi:hypothetical protein
MAAMSLPIVITEARFSRRGTLDAAANMVLGKRRFAPRPRLFQRAGRKSTYRLRNKAL